jgi:hypothetical protein
MLYRCADRVAAVRDAKDPDETFPPLVPIASRYVDAAARAGRYFAGAAAPAVTLTSCGRVVRESNEFDRGRFGCVRVDSDGVRDEVAHGAFRLLSASHCRQPRPFPIGGSK